MNKNCIREIRVGASWWLNSVADVLVSIAFSSRWRLWRKTWVALANRLDAIALLIYPRGSG